MSEQHDPRCIGLQGGGFAGACDCFILRGLDRHAITGQIPSDDHFFKPVAGHPDDDECTYRSDGTDATYCALPESAHEWTRPMNACRWTVGPVWKLNGETCVCYLDIGHDGPHECTCGSRFEGCGRRNEADR